MNYEVKYPKQRSNVKLFNFTLSCGSEMGHYCMPKQLQYLFVNYIYAKQARLPEVQRIEEMTQSVMNGPANIEEFIMFCDENMSRLEKRTLKKSGCQSMANAIKAVVCFSKTGSRLPLFSEELKYN